MVRRMPDTTDPAVFPGLAAATRFNRNNKQEALLRLKRTLEQEGMPPAEIDEIIGNAGNGYGDLPDDDDQDDDDGDDRRTAAIKILKRLAQQRHADRTRNAPPSPSAAGMSFAMGDTTTRERADEVFREFAGNVGCRLLSRAETEHPTGRSSFISASDAAAMSVALSTNDSAMTDEHANRVAQEFMSNRSLQGNRFDSPGSSGRRPAILAILRRLQRSKDNRHDGPRFLVTDQQLASDVNRLTGLFRKDLGDSWADFLREIRQLAEEAGYFKNTQGGKTQGTRVSGYVDQDESTALSMTPAGEPVADVRADAVADSLMANRGGGVFLQQRPTTYR